MFKATLLNMFKKNTDLDITIVSPLEAETVIGPLQVNILLGPHIVPGEITGSIDGNAVKGIVDLPHCSFLFPSPEKESTELTITITPRNPRDKAIIQCLPLRFRLLPEDYFEKKPYELIGPRQEGRVLKRDHIYSSGPPNPVPHRETLDMLLSDAISPVLDVGCGAGAYVSELNRHGVDCQGIEINPHYVTEGLQSHLPVQTYDGKKIPFPDNAFNSVMSIEVLEHVDDWEPFLAEMLRVAKHRVIITTPNIGVLSQMSKHGVVPWHLLESTHLNFFTKEIWRHIILNIDGVTGSVVEYSSLILNGDRFNYHLYVLIEKIQ